MSDSFIVGQVVILEDVITNPALADVLTDDGSEACVVYLPDGTTVAPVVTRESLGTYTAQFTPTLTGNHEYVFTSTGLGAGAGRGRFYVSPTP